MKTLCLAALTCLLSTFMCAQLRQDSLPPFDKPVKKVLDLGPSPYYLPSQNMRKKLNCYIYRTFMVKEYDEGQKGAEWLSILPFQAGGRPACSLSHLSGEKVIHDDISGYFNGAKDSFVFFQAADGIDGGIPFVVYDTRTGTQVFHDSAYLRRTMFKPLIRTISMYCGKTNSNSFSDIGE